jgi:hypothetical protein
MDIHAAVAQVRQKFGFTGARSHRIMDAKMAVQTLAEIVTVPSMPLRKLT